VEVLSSQTIRVHGEGESVLTLHCSNGAVRTEAVSFDSNSYVEVTL